MTTSNYIEDPSTGIKADVADGIEKNALVVATRNLKKLFNQQKFFISQDGSIDLNVDGSAGGTPEQVHDGIDTVLWTGSAIVGPNWTFNF